MPTVHLSDRALIQVTGPDAEALLQNVITPDLDALQPGAAKPGALLTPQGKILFDFLISRHGADGLRIECRAETADELVGRLKLYKLRAKADIKKENQNLVAVSWPDDSTPSQSDSSASESDSAAGLTDLRFPADAGVRRFYDAPPPASAGLEDWHRHRIAAGVAESGADYALGDAFPHDVLLDQNDGIGFKKGCYVGQEVVSRMQHRGTARRRILIAEADGPLPEPGTPVTADGRAIGTLGSSVGPTGLALVRIDKARDAMDAGTAILAGETALHLRIPPGVRFGFPEDATTGNG
ncbi:CAF17-like 4Fe-4S cluster assembly/insertion protein YgfZ [Mesorhizobium xinjiangense]|uniref:CAF17-like 4Fe-4S cluster assembly/insertion protein YgfZ n=1 Tax=Mesorhizobium xinjiangense TaxID=2678685 RepID=UPI0012EEBA3D|nr:folate-binding protein YgfZ [Mesorhizobium xinjiangense]